MSQKKILVPLWPSGKDLKGVHYALSLAERLQAKVYILQEAGLNSFGNPISDWLEETLLDLINSARQSGLAVSHHIAHRGLEVEIVGLVKDEGIDVLVLEEGGWACERLLLHIKPLISSRIILVKEKDHVDYL